MYPLLQGLDHSLPSYMQNEYHTFWFTKRLSVAGVVATLIRGMEDWEEFAHASVRHAHVTQEVRDKYKDHIHWSHIPDHAVYDGYEHPGFEETDHVISEKLEEGLTFHLHFPLMAESVEGLPATYIITVESDTLRDDGYLYAKRLRDVGIPVRHDNSAGGFHGMITFFDTVSAAQKTFDNITEYIDNVLHSDS